MANTRPAPNCPRACSHCRQRKVRCDGEKPCANCASRDETCFYPLSRRGKGVRTKPRAHSSVRDRLARIENLIQTSTNTRSPAQTEQHCASELSFIDNHRPDQSGVGQHLLPLSQGTSPDLTSHFNSSGPTGSISASSRVSAPLYNPHVGHHSLRASSVVSPSQATLIADPDTVEPASPGADCNIPPRTRICDYHGPGSWLAICSEPGVAWIREKTGCADFSKSTQRLTMTTANNRWWRISNPSMALDNDEPDVETAWKYTSAFFDHCFEAIFGIVHRPEFEARLRAHFAQPPNHYAEDAAWYALRNTVYAAGCRQLLLKSRSMSYTEAQGHAFRYFDKALRVHTDLIYGPPTLDAVRAVAAMLYYADGVGNQSFEYTMGANAVCLAQAIGLHRQASRSLHLSAGEILHRNWLFWAIYCCEKQVAFRLGRPSFIDDTSVTCDIPDQAPQGSTINVAFFKHAIRMSQLTWQIDCRLTSPAALRQDASELIQAAMEMSQLIEDWGNSLSNLWPVGTPIIQEQLPPNVRPLHILYLHYAYYAGIQTAFIVFACPWLSAILNIDKDPLFRRQVTARNNQVAQAARDLILIFKSMELDAGLPPWATFYFPMSALTSLFIFLLSSPTSPSAQADIALLDIAAGHFSHMEYLTSLELGASFSRDAAHLAREAVRKAKHQVVSRPNPVSPRHGSELDSNTLLLPQPEIFDADQFDHEGWNLYSMEATDDWLTGSDLLDFSRFSQP